MMTKAESVKWLESLKQEIGKTKNCSLWHYAEAIDMVIEVMSEPKTGAKIVPKEESDMYIIGYRDGHDDATKTARWIKDDDYVCDYCGYHMIVGGGAYNYCPNCGARMRI